jgi:transposase
MPKTRQPYALEFRRQMIDLVRAGRDPEDLAREFEPTSQSIRNWVIQADPVRLHSPLDAVRPSLTNGSIPKRSPQERNY